MSAWAYLVPVVYGAVVLAVFVAYLRYAYSYTTYLVEGREFSHEAAARDYLASFHDDVPRRVIRRRRFQWRDAP